MSQALTNLTGAVPAHIAAFGGALVNSDLSGGVTQSYPIVSYKGKVWAVTTNGDREIILMDNGEDPAPSIEAVIIKANPHLNKIYYPDGYEEGSSEKPTCYSNDSIAPAADAEHKQATRCGACQWNQWGSKITENGAKGKACSDARRLAIAPAGDLENPMLLRVPAASLKELLAYGENLTKRGVPYQALVTKIGFDSTVAYPKLTFKTVRWLDEEEVASVKEMMDSDLVQAITALNALSPPEAAAPVEEEGFSLPPGPAPATVKAKVTSKRQAVAAEVAEAIEPADAAPPKKSGFGGKSKVVADAAEPAVQASGETSTAQVLAEGAVAELDKVLAGFDDEA